MDQVAQNGSNHKNELLAITFRAVEAIAPDRRNARTHSKRQVEQIVTSVTRFGFTNPILVDEAGAIIAGHGWLLAAKSLVSVMSDH